MKTTHKYLLLFLINVSILITSTSSFAQIQANKGNLDLSSFDFKNTGSIELNGEWEFYPDKLLSPSDFKTTLNENPNYVNVPSLWSVNHFPEKNIFNIGYGTYRLKIKLPSNIDVLAIRLKRIETSYKIWFGDSLIVQTGQISNKKEEAVPQQKTVSKIFSVNKSETEIIIQVSNFVHRKGGIDDSIILGTPKEITNKNRIANGYEMFILGVLLIMAVFHMGLFFFGRKDYSLLFFSLLLTSEIISLMTNGEVLLSYIFPDLSWAILKRTDYISNFLRLTFLTLFFYKVYSKDISKIYALIITGINVVMSIIVLITDLSFYSFTLFIFIAGGALSILYILYAQIKSIFNRTEGALIPFIGTFLLLVTSVNDTLFVSDIIQTLYLIPFGMFIFIFSQSYLLSYNFSNLYKKTEDLNKLASALDEVKNSLLQRSSFNLKDSLEVLVNRSNASSCFIFSVLSGKHILKSKYSVSEDLNYREVFPGNLIQNSIAEKRSIIVSNIETDPYYDKTEIIYQNIKSSICIPLIISNNVRAVLYFENSLKKHAFSQHHKDLFENLSAQIVGLIDNINFYKEQKELNLNLETIVSTRTKDVRNQRDQLEEQKNEIEAINDELKDTLEEISRKNKIITESINFAKLTQVSNLPSETLINSLFADNFILFRPKEELSGDFYWAKKINIPGKEIAFLSLVDCTGHGVPGAVMSVIGNGMLNEALINKKIYKPSVILDELQKDIESKLGEDTDNISVKDGMDIAVISYDKQENIFEYAGAKLDLLIFRNGKLTEVPADKISIGADQHSKFKDLKFTNRKMKVKNDDIIYLFTDGFQDQFGGEKDTKFMKKNFRSLLEEINQLPFTIQKSRLLKTLNRWQGDKIQNDDISVIGIKI